MNAPTAYAPVTGTKRLRWAIACIVIALVIVPANTMVWLQAAGGIYSPHHTLWLTTFLLLAGIQTLTGLLGLVFGVSYAFSNNPTSEKVVSIIMGVFGLVLAAGGVVGGFFGAVFASSNGFGMGGAWGRPLRVRGKQLHPEVREGSDWTAGDRPDASRLDDATKRALEALWLHDAQKEHASVPAFSRVSWMLAAVGAPPELVEGAHRAALEEAEHTKLCFALAAGYGGRTHTVEPMPDLLLGGLAVKTNAYEVLAIESLEDGCLLEDFNADVAAACARVCEDPVTRAVLEQIAREERSHADFSWAVLEWVMKLHPVRIDLERLDRVVRPTSASARVAPLVAAANATELRRHGRLTDDEWAACWNERVVATRARASAMFKRAGRAPSRTAPQPHAS